jgi:hypothetical protein
MASMISDAQEVLVDEQEPLNGINLMQLGQLITMHKQLKVSDSDMAIYKRVYLEVILCQLLASCIPMSPTLEPDKVYLVDGFTIEYRTYPMDYIRIQKGSASTQLRMLKGTNYYFHNNIENVGTTVMIVRMLCNLISGIAADPIAAMQFDTTFPWWNAEQLVLSNFWGAPMGKTIPRKPESWFQEMLKKHGYYANKRNITGIPNELELFCVE